MPIIYDHLSSIPTNDDLLAASFNSNRNYGVIDMRGNIIVPFQYNSLILKSLESNLFVAQKEMSGSYAYIDASNGNEITPFEYKHLTSFSEGLSPVIRDHFYSYIDESGTDVISPVYNLAVPFENGLAYVGLDNLYGYIDKSNNEVIPIIYDELMGSPNGLMLASKDKLFGVINSLGETVVPFEYQTGRYASDEYIILMKSDDYDEFMDTGADYVNYIVTNNAFVPEAPTPAPTAPTATKTNSAVLVNGKSIDFQAYKIDNNNYFKLRDIAEVLSGTEKQFEVTWNNDKQSIELMSNKAYTSVGGELVTTGAEAKNVSVTTSSMYVDGKSVDLQAYKIDDNNYFKLRDLGTIFDFEISWDGTNNVITVDTSKGYTPE